MKFSAVTFACMATGALATPPTRVFERDLATVSGVIGTVGSDIDALDTAVKSYNGQSGPIVQAADTLIQAMKDGTTKVDGSSMLTLTDALGLQAPVKELQGKAENLLTDFKAKKPDIEKAGQCGLVRTKLGDINTNGQALIKAIISKVPQEAQSIAQSLAAGVTNVLNQAADEFSTSKCVDQGGSGSSSSGGSSATSATSGGSTATSAPGTSATATGSAPGGGATGGYPVPSASPTGGYSTPANGGGYPAPTGAVPTGAPTVPGAPVVTAGAALVAPAGIMAAAMAAILL
ncbi:hypothetical protein CDD82_4939 [Ophiocordyceps australis]|uniref:Cell wall protein n=1 Tax=Ophiocordyceps australis TaxID=1399860 RepID=A0A2C5Z413_9HYPO|nr:hypothetical protein CDD82_4939 [Ophiocordyceps australis]